MQKSNFGAVDCNSNTVLTHEPDDVSDFESVCPPRSIDGLTLTTSFQRILRDEFQGILGR